MFLQSSLRIASLAGVWVRANTTAPNAITLIGFFLTWKMITWRWQGIADVYTFSFLIGAVITDYLDGLIAKRYNQTTALGSALDKLRDKILIISTFLFIYQTFVIINDTLSRLIKAELILLITIEFLLFLIGAIVSMSGAKLKANESGRWKMGFECSVAICWALIHDLGLLGFSMSDTFPQGLIFVLLLVTLFLAAASTRGQMRDNWPLIKRLAAVIRNYY